MNFNSLKYDIKTISDSFRQNTAVAINTHLTVRNWQIGFYIVEYEQNGEDRAKYGAKLLQINKYIPQFFQKYFGTIGQSSIAKLQLIDNSETPIGQSLIAQLDKPNNLENTFPVEKLIQKLSYTHLTLLFPIEDPLKRLSKIW